ncbi:hypothetical protein KY290_016036 [Solanum tuberosum]|uniref:Uncharacterized protein n=1 Tax=Solanum tuberosum TaxID=4113 RepID=A0ABQ7VUU8_SOLTU|nr:hypothetical protein KY289_014648 [Solanum tuberosum]KAH0699792.1 hypothetical protein KY284_014007 [Solanum tuberosum]KAH0772055.1 hypothetical protein KY290_016036 [Solanum tuberosum]
MQQHHQVWCLHINSSKSIRRTDSHCTGFENTLKDHDDAAFSYTKTFDSVPALRKAVILGYNPIRPWMSVVYRWLDDFNSRECFYDGLSYGTQHTLQNF